mmetsp:Transcript_15454/g.42729  ORF Transcript_15454/g.42729 Transcript_15454/m.42729 type:complete len:137 (+) Transcript_15454:508-918(+)
MEEYDRLLLESHPGLKHVRWVHRKTMLQVLVGSVRDGTYALHSDKGPHNNTKFSKPPHSPEDVAEFLLLPPGALMRVATIVISTVEGDTAAPQEPLSSAFRLTKTACMSRDLLPRNFTNTRSNRCTPAQRKRGTKV